MNRKLMLTLLALAAAPLAQAEMYRWTDAKGTVHYSQSPPPQGKYAAVTPKAPPPTASPNMDALRKTLDESAPKPAKPTQTASTTEGAQRQQLCAQARERLDYLNNHNAHQLATKLPDGAYERWTDEKYASEKTLAQQQQAKNC
ncbi:MAG TPA: DUF4124 domain-containing protein [Solimonas sp.]|nr:DUF4124 domain-containing protein [Solimonas sp.]